ncbi:DUF6795 domain-containing protein [Roseateles chitinivorans]|uniref:DUF6795 domain-containing protein n=1 Tax=Roseateles chitinivorans TaxID=2917965 RepID=UPI003D67B7A1
MKRIAAWLAVLTLALFALGLTMAFFKTFTLFSAVEGTVLMEGKPVEGLEVQQTWSWHWGEKKGSAVTRTDAQGRFHFPVVTGRSITGSLLPHQPVIEQSILFVHQGKVIDGWSHGKDNYEDQGELKGKPLRLVCDLKDEAVGRPEIRSFGICTVQP